MKCIRRYAFERWTFLKKPEGRTLLSWGPKTAGKIYSRHRDGRGGGRYCTDPMPGTGTGGQAILASRSIWSQSSQRQKGTRTKNKKTARELTFVRKPWRPGARRDAMCMQPRKASESHAGNGGPSSMPTCWKYLSGFHRPKSKKQRNKSVPASATAGEGQRPKGDDWVLT